MQQREQRHSCAVVRERAMVLWAQKDSEGRVSWVSVMPMSEGMHKTQPVKNPSTQLSQSMMNQNRRLPNPK